MPLDTDTEFLLQMIHARRRRRGNHQTLDSLHLKYPEVGPDNLKELAAGRAALVK
jgi:hypothetical protein